MATESSIEWTKSDDGTPGATWNPVVGCSKVSTGCSRCYAIKDAWRMAHNPNPKLSNVYSGLVEKKPGGNLEWTGEVKCITKRLYIPGEWKTPKRIFVNSQSDLFHPSVPFEFIDDVFYAIQRYNWHTYIILTKRPDRLLEWADSTNCRHYDILSIVENCWIGVSVENQEQADKRIPPLLDLLGLADNPHLIGFLSCEPLLQEIKIARFFCHSIFCKSYPRKDEPMSWATSTNCTCPKLRWVIAGGESGYKARPMQENWARSLQQQCQAANVAFFYKQKLDEKGKKVSLPILDGQRYAEFPKPCATGMEG